MNDVRKDGDRKDQQVKDMEAQLQMMRAKLEDAQRNLESNAQMITWLNKQLNEKPGIGGSFLPPN